MKRINYKMVRLIKSLRLFVRKMETSPTFVNGRLPPVLRKQMESILKQAKKLDVEDL